MPRGGARPGAGRKPKSLKDRIPPPEITDETVIFIGGADSPVEFLLGVMNHTELKLSVRMQAAAILAPFLHAKPAAIGKKEARNDEAESLSGPFDKAAPPKLVATGGKKL